MKEDYWQNFLKNLKENEFDNALKDYLEAIEYISQVSVKDIDKEETREEINNKLQNVEKYEKYDWAKDYIKARGENADPVFRKESLEYKRKYGICTPNILESEEEGKSTAKKTEESKDWILSKFGSE